MDASLVAFGGSSLQAARAKPALKSYVGGICTRRVAAQQATARSLRLDNHWLVVAGATSTTRSLQVLQSL